MATNHDRILLFLVFSCILRAFDASAGDSDPLYRACIGNCEKTGCAGESCFSHCKLSSDGSSVNAPRYMKWRRYLLWKQWDCQNNCRYHCMLDREKERGQLGQVPVKYHGKWLFQRLYGFQEPLSAILSALNFLVHFHGWLSFFYLLYEKLPLKPDKRPYYDFTGLFHIYGLLAMNSWFWNAVFHSRDVELTEKLDYLSAVALLGFSLILAILRSFSIKDDAARVMVAAPLIAFTTTHILFLNNYKMNYGWNVKVCAAMGAGQHLIWAIWAGASHHPSYWKLWIVIVGGGLAILLEVLDFPPYKGLIDAHALRHAATIPLTYIWWSFIRDDAEYRTSSLLGKLKKVK